MESSAKKKRIRGRDRLSDLPDAILGHVLSFLPTEEAGRVTILSRRWRNAFADVVHTISFSTSASRSDLNRTLHKKLFSQVTSALLARRRWDGGEEAPLRSLRVAMHGYRGGARAPWRISPDSCAVDQWLAYALTHGVQELHLQTSTRCHDIDMTFPLCCGRDNDEMGHQYTNTYVVPAKLFSCATLRSLHLGSCSLPQNLASTIELPSLETLALCNISYGDSVSSSAASASARDIQLLISACPRLTDLTLEACHQIQDITVDNRLRSFALRCCHNVRRLAVDLSETRLFEYVGEAPNALVSHGAPTIARAKIHICREAPSGKIGLESLGSFLLLFVNATHLHLGWPDVTQNSPPGYDNLFASLFPRFPNVTRLELESRCAHAHAVDVVTGILRQTPNLTALSLKLGNHKSSIAYPRFAVGELHVPVVPCLQERVREMSVELYEGADVQRVLLKTLLRGALVLESVRVVFASGRYGLDVLTDEIKTWPANPATRMTLLTFSNETL